MLLSDRDLNAELASGRIRLDPSSEDMVQPSSIDVRIDRYFKERRKKLTPGRRQKLEAAMPDEVQLTECTMYGQKTVSEADMDQWCADAGIK